MEGYGGARQATEDNTIRRISCVCWITDSVYTHAKARAHIICNTCCFSTATVVLRTLCFLFIITGFHTVTHLHGNTELLIKNKSQSVNMNHFSY